MTTHDRQGTEGILAAKRRRLQFLELQQAREGFSTPPEILMEIEELRTEITALEAQLLIIQRGAPSTTPPLPTESRFISAVGQPRLYVLSYSRVDGVARAQELFERLTQGVDPLQVWPDPRAPEPEEWEAALDDAVKHCQGMILLLSADSVAPDGGCEEEWKRALRYKKPLIVLRIQPQVQPPPALGARVVIDGSGAGDTAAALRAHLHWLETPEGVLQTLEDRRGDVQRDLQRIRDPQRKTRLDRELRALEEDIAWQRQVVDDAARVQREAEARIQADLERERQPEQPVRGVYTTRFINKPPVAPPSNFQDRTSETQRIGRALLQPGKRLITVVGRGGAGKTALVVRLLKALEQNQLPDKGGQLTVDGIVYLSAIGGRHITGPNLFHDLAKLLPPAMAEQLGQIYTDSQVDLVNKMGRLLEHFGTGRSVVLLDNFETLVDVETLAMTDREVEAMLTAILLLPDHEVRVILTTRFLPQTLATVQPGRQVRIDLEEGLPSPFGETLLRELDEDGSAGLRDAPEAMLASLREQVRGLPRALETLYGLLLNDHNLSLTDLKVRTATLLPEQVVEVLVGEAFSRLDGRAQAVLTALAVYGRPVPAVAVDVLLQPWVPGLDSAPLLGRLVNMKLVRRDEGRYALHPVDREYALAQLPDHSAGDSADVSPWTQSVLLGRAADYWHSVRRPRAEWKTLDDLAPQLSEFDLRVAAREYDTAAEILREIAFDYLLRWGYYRLSTERYEQVIDRLSDPRIKRGSLLDLGIAYYNLGELQRAIEYLEQALAIARQIGERDGEGAALGNLGNAYWSLGELQRAIGYHEQHLAIAREIIDRRGEGTTLGNLGVVYWSLGELQRAIGYYEQQLAITREISDRDGEGLVLGNLGEAYLSLGKAQQAITLCEQALSICRETGNRPDEAFVLVNIGYAYREQQQYTAALNSYAEALSIADQIEDTQSQQEARVGAAQVYLVQGDLHAAWTCIEEAMTYDRPDNNHNALTLRGIITFRRGDNAAAGSSWHAAVDSANVQLEQTPQNYDALYAKGLALSGLTVVEGAHYASAARAAYEAASAITRAPGILAENQRWFSLVAEKDTRGILREVAKVLA